MEIYRRWRFDPARECFEHANDLNALMPLLLMTGDRIRLSRPANQAKTKGQNNVAFACRVQLGETEKCVNLLITAGRASEAVPFSRTFAPS